MINVASHVNLGQIEAQFFYGHNIEHNMSKMRVLQHSIISKIEP